MWTEDDVLSFVWARHRAWEGKQVEDDIVRTRKFTNVFRVLDRGSQYLLRLMSRIYGGSDESRADQLALSYLYRQINRPDTFDDIIKKNDGYIPNLEEITDPVWIKDVMCPVINSRPGNFLNGAYVILIRTGDPHSLGEKMVSTFPLARGHLIMAARKPYLHDRVRVLQGIHGLGPFLSMQIATDLGYCPGEQDQENSYILPGPGAQKGVGFLLHGGKPASMSETVRIIESFPVQDMPTLPWSNGRKASLMDVQNVFCEFSKYARFSGRVIPSKPYERHSPFKVRIPEQFIIDNGRRTR